MKEYLWQLTSYIFISGIVILLIELVLSIRWSRFYFIFGIPIYQHDEMVQSGIERVPTAEEIEAALPESGRRAPMLVRRIDEYSFAFREKLFHFGISYSPVMHGYITCNPATGQIVSRGYVNWYILVFSCYFLSFPLVLPIGQIAIVIPICLMVMITYIFLMQKKRFRQVEDAVRTLCAR